MDKIDLAKPFSARLRETMIAAGFHSQRSTSGVDIHKLVEITGHSPQICRKYLHGQTLPEPVKLLEIATKLNVSPGWLMFGEAGRERVTKEGKLTISTNLLLYIFTQASELYNGKQPSDEIADFLLDLSEDISQINASEEQSRKIIDLALSSAKHFSRSF